jgi:hypothetical protein
LVAAFAVAGCAANPKAGSVGGIEAVRGSGFDSGCILEVKIINSGGREYEKRI